MNKKASELSLTVIIVAILALLVLVVLSYIFINKNSQVQDGINSCEDKGGRCAPACGNPDFGTEDMSFPLPSAVAACDKLDGTPQKCCTKSLS